MQQTAAAAQEALPIPGELSKTLACHAWHLQQCAAVLQCHTALLTR
jgi:hypothetical protein